MADKTHAKVPVKTIPQKQEVKEDKDDHKVQPNQAQHQQPHQSGSSSNHPKECNILEVRSYNEEDIFLAKKSFPILSEGQSLIKVHATPITHFDFMKINGKVPFIKPPFIPGSECSGTVLESKGVQAHHYTGKKVAVSSLEGCFRDYLVANNSNILVLDDHANLDESSGAYINPLTSYGLCHVTLEHHPKAIILSGANSAIGKMLRKQFQLKNITVINLVRSEEKVNELKKEGEIHVLDINNPEFEQHLQELSEKLKPNVALDSVSGELSGVMLKHLVPGGVIINFGSLSHKPMLNIDSEDFILNNKNISGFGVYAWNDSLSDVEREQAHVFIRQNFQSMFKPEIQQKLPITSYKEGFKVFKSNTTNGKILLTFQ